MTIPLQFGVSGQAEAGDIHKTSVNISGFPSDYNIGQLAALLSQGGLTNGGIMVGKPVTYEEKLLAQNQKTNWLLFAGIAGVIGVLLWKR